MPVKIKPIVICFFLILIFSSFTLYSNLKTSRAAGLWTTPVNLSSKMPQAWFPDLAIDSEGAAHVIFAGSDFYTEKDSPLWEKYDKVYYQSISASGNVSETGPFNIAVSPYGVVTRNSLAVDNNRGLLHMLFRSKGSLYYQYAPISKATSPIAWSQPRNIDDFGSSYYSDIVVDQKGVIHIIWTQVQPDNAGKLRQVVMYRQSSDLGVSWSFPKMIAMPKYAATKPAIKLDASGGLHVTWDDGYDNYVASDFVATSGAYTRSLDNGKTWSAPIWFGSEKEPIAQMTLTPFGDNGVMLVWRVLTAQRLDYAISNDRGATWSSPLTVPGNRARSFTAQHFFDRYYLAADGAGRVHLVNVAQTREVKLGENELPDDLAIYHNVWTKGEWTDPEEVAQLTGYPEYPRLAIGPDRLHLVWFVRDSNKDEGNKQLWYSSRPYDTGLKAQPLGSYTPPTPTVIAQASSAKAAPTAAPVLPPLEDNLPRSWIEEGYGATLLSLLPVLLIAVLLVVTLFWRVRRGVKK